MALNAAALILASNGIAAGITHAQLHSVGSGPAWTTNAVGSRFPVTESVNATTGEISFTVNATGLAANQAVDGISYWSASTGGTNYGGTGGAAFTGDATANSLGEYSVTVTETPSAS